jgi:hypothetical protein
MGERKLITNTQVTDAYHERMSVLCTSQLLAYGSPRIGGGRGLAKIGTGVQSEQRTRRSVE